MPAKKSSPKRASPKRSPVRKAVRAVEYTLNQVDAEPSREIFRVMNYFAYMFVLCALAATIAYIYYVDKANDAGLYDDGALSLDSADTSFKGVVIAALLYYVARHHFSHHHY